MSTKPARNPLPENGAEIALAQVLMGFENRGGTVNSGQASFFAWPFPLREVRSLASLRRYESASI